MLAVAMPLGLVACQAAAPRQDAMLQPAAAIIDGGSNAFIGFDGQALANAFGQPQMVRTEPPAEVWQYAGFDCVVDFYLYVGEAGGLAVAYVEARNQAAESTPADRCVKSLMQSVSVETKQKTL